MEANRIYNEDCLLTLQRMPDKCCDVFTDPKYNVGKDYGEMVNDKMSEDEYKQWITKLFTELKRVANTIVIYTPHNWQFFYWQVLGPDFIQIVLTHNAKNGFYRNYVNKTAILLTNASPGKAEQVENIWRNIELPGLGYFGKEPKNEHPGYTTLQVTQTAIQKLCKSSLIYDPQMGSGTTALSAIKCGKDYLGSELNPKWIKQADKRINEYLSKPELFKKSA